MLRDKLLVVIQLKTLLFTLKSFYIILFSLHDTVIIHSALSTQHSAL